MKGIDTVQEYCSRAFDKLDEIVGALKKEARIDPEVYENLSNCISSAKTYVKSHYAYNLDIESKCASHCVALACSDAENGNPDLIRRCTHEHTLHCHHCDQLPILFASIMALLEDNRQSFTPFTYAEMQYDLKNAFEQIKEQKVHLVRTFVQNLQWSRLYNQNVPEAGVAFITMDWGKTNECFTKYCYDCCFILQQ